MSDQPRPFSDREKAREAGRKGGIAKAEKERRPGLQDMGALDTAADAQRWLREIGAAVLAKKLDSRDADTAIKAVKTWLDAFGSSLASKDLRDVRAELEALKESMRPRIAS